VVAATNLALVLPHRVRPVVQWCWNNEHSVSAPCHPERKPGSSLLKSLDSCFHRNDGQGALIRDWYPNSTELGRPRQRYDFRNSEIPVEIGVCVGNQALLLVMYRIEAKMRRATNRWRCLRCRIDEGFFCGIIRTTGEHFHSILSTSGLHQEARTCAFERHIHRSNAFLPMSVR
jgi:hypothetical protein